MEGLNPPRGEPVRHLYVHVPYCHKICPYCSFYKHLPSEGNPAGFPAALLAEARALVEGPVPLALETVYFGGGTPTFLPTAVLENFLPELASILNFGQVQEWTMEINPRTIDAKKAAVLRGCGVNRASLGVQAWDAESLEILGRDHSPAEGEEAFRILRDSGFPSVSIDLMFSVPGRPVSAWEASLKKTLSLQPDHISAYNLTYEEDTEFFRKCLAGIYSVEESRDEEEFALAMELLQGSGYLHYEISNYAKPGRESLHNQSYWAGGDYAGLGPGAVSTIHGQRYRNIPSTTVWQDSARAGKVLRVEHEEITPTKWLCERLALGFRTSTGLPAQWLQGAQPAITRLLEEGLIRQDGNFLKLTHRGKFVADGVISHLWEEMDS